MSNSKKRKKYQKYQIKLLNSSLIGVIFIMFIIVTIFLISEKTRKKTPTASEKSHAATIENFSLCSGIDQDINSCTISGAPRITITSIPPPPGLSGTPTPYVMSVTYNDVLIQCSTKCSDPHVPTTCNTLDCTLGSGWGQKFPLQQEAGNGFGYGIAFKTDNKTLQLDDADPGYTSTLTDDGEYLFFTWPYFSTGSKNVSFYILSPTPTLKISPTVNLTVTSTLIPSKTPTLTETITLTPRFTITPTLTRTSTPTLTRIPSPSRTQTPTPTLFKTATPYPTSTKTVTPTLTKTNTPTLTKTNTVSPTKTHTPLPSKTHTPTVSPSPTTLPSVTNTLVPPSPTITPTTFLVCELYDISNPVDKVIDINDFSVFASQYRPFFPQPEASGNFNAASGDQYVDMTDFIFFIEAYNNFKETGTCE